MKKRGHMLAAALVLSGIATLLVAAAPESSDKETQKGLERARNTVRMLDDVYKTTIVLITDKYVHTETDFPAGSAAVQLFAAINKKGWHNVRLIDATGAPYKDTNVAQDDFEKEGVKQLKAGKDYYEKVVEENGKRYLRAITPVPVVMQKCVMCHPHYEDAKQGEPIGAITYKMPID